MEKAGATFTTVVDERNLVGQLYGYKAIPNGFLINESGYVAYKKLGGFDIRRSETREAVLAWAGDSLDDDNASSDSATALDPQTEANRLFLQGQDSIRDGNRAEAALAWRKAAELEPENWIIRKQLWALENPDKFYEGNVDFDWQKEQIQQGR